MKSELTAPPLTRRQVLKLASAAAALAAWPAGRAAGQSPSPPESQRNSTDPLLLRAAFVADAHLGAPGVNDCFLTSFNRAIAAVNRLSPAPDFVVFGGDLAHLGNPQALGRGAALLDEIRVPLWPVVGEHDWYLDLGDTWQKRFGRPYYSFACRGVHCVVLNSVANDDAWAQPTRDPRERALTAAGIRDGCAPLFAVGRGQCEWLHADLAGLSPDTPVLVFSHLPLYDLYAPWGFCTRDAAVVQKILARMEKVTVVHGHTHSRELARLEQVTFCGMPSTAWASTSVPKWPRLDPTRCAAPATRLTTAASAAGFGVLELHRSGRCRVIDHMT